MSDLMKYRGYLGSVDYDDEDKAFYGQIQFIRGLVAYEGTDVESLNKGFREAVDDYLKTCEEEGIKPQKTFKGSFNVRVSPEGHRDLAMAALSEGVGLNKFIKETLEARVGPNVQIRVQPTAKDKARLKSLVAASPVVPSSRPKRMPATKKRRVAAKRSHGSKGKRSSPGA